MTTKRIIYARPDGGVSVVHPAPSHRLVWVAKDHDAAARADAKAASLKAAEATARDATAAAQNAPKDIALASAARDLAAMLPRLKAEADAAARLVISDFRPDGVRLDRLQKIVRDTGRKIEILEQESEDEWLARVQAKAVPAGAKDIAIIEASELPKDRTNRDAWVRKDNAVAVDMSRSSQST